MCFNLKSQLIALKKRIKHSGLTEDEYLKEIEKIVEELEIQDYHQVSAFQHPVLPIFTNKSPEIPVASNWGLVPSWIKSDEHKIKLWNGTVNARCESIFEKPSFRKSAKYHRCILCIDGFYEHYHFKGDRYPYYIQLSNKQPMTVAGLYSNWKNEGGITLNTFAIITTVANPLMAEIHNNPKNEESRMPVILKDESVEKWLDIKNGKEALQDLFIPFPEVELEAHTVRKLQGKGSVGNVPKASEEYIYPELSQKDNMLF